MWKDISLWQILIVVGLIVLLFGAKRLPDLARGTGRALRIFKSEVRDLREDRDLDDETRPEPKAVKGGVVASGDDVSVDEVPATPVDPATTRRAG